MLIASVIIYFVFSLILNICFFEKASFSKILIVFYLCVISINILVAEILGLLHLLNHPWIYLSLQSLFCIGFSFLIHHFSPLSNQKIATVCKFVNLHFSKLEWFILILISATIFSFFMVGISTPINNLDSLATHLPRIYYWLQHGSFDFWPASNLWQQIYPINAHIQGLWLFLLGKSENLFFLVQWFSLIVITASIFEISKFLGFSKTQSLISSLIGLSLPVALLQIFSFQGDLIVTTFVMIFILFILLYSNTKKILFLLSACLCLMIDLATKQTAFLIIPVSGLLILYLLIKNKSFKGFLNYSWLLIVFMIAFVSFQLIQNWIYTGSIFGVNSLVTEKSTSYSQIGQKALYIIPRYLYQFIGFDGLPRSIQPELIRAKETVFKRILNPLGFDLEKEVFLQPGFDQNESFQYSVTLKLSEDTAWFGPFAFLIIPMATIIAFFSKNKLRRKYVALCVINALICLILLIIQRAGWDPYQGRYFILIIFPFLPMVSIIFPKRRIFFGFLSGTIIIISLILILNTLFINDSKPIMTARTQNDIINQYISKLPETNEFQSFVKKSLLNIAYPTKYSSQLVNIYEATYYDRLYYLNNSTAKNIGFINQIIPDGEPISIMISNDPLEYGLFGKNRSRSLFPVANLDDSAPGYFLISNSFRLQLPSTMKLLGRNNDYSIFYKGIN